MRRYVECEALGLFHSTSNNNSGSGKVIVVRKAASSSAGVGASEGAAEEGEQGDTDKDGPKGSVGQFFKFPRTHHLVNTGGSAVSRDDLVLNVEEFKFWIGSGRVLRLEEKVDGANLGISLSADWEV